MKPGRENVDYHAYLRSPQWRAKKAERLEIDCHMCARCKATDADTSLECHHKHYRTLGREDVLTDLVTMCTDCHRRYHVVKQVVREWGPDFWFLF